MPKNTEGQKQISSKRARRVTITAVISSGAKKRKKVWINAQRTHTNAESMREVTFQNIENNTQTQNLELMSRWRRGGHNTKNICAFNHRNTTYHNAKYRNYDISYAKYQDVIIWKMSCQNWYRGMGQI